MKKEIYLLVLDDEENILKSLKRIFMNDSFEVATASNPDEAMQILAKEKIKVVLSDFRMPTITGVEFLRQVRDWRHVAQFVQKQENRLSVGGGLDQRRDDTVRHEG